MLGRQRHQTRLLVDWEAPAKVESRLLDGREVDPAGLDFVIGGVGLSSLAEQELWRRLHLGELQKEAPLQLVLDASADDLAALVPGSRWDRVATAAGGHAWRDALGLDTPQRAFAWLPRTKCVFVGAATEEAWDEALRLLRESSR